MTNAVAIRRHVEPALFHRIFETTQLVLRVAAFPCLHSGTAFVRQGQSPESEDPFRETCGIVPDILVIIIQIGRAHSELQSLMRISYAVFCLKKKKNNNKSIKLHTQLK